MSAKEDQRRRLRLRTEQFDRAVRLAFGVRTDTEVARELGVHPSVLAQYRRGTRFVGERFIVTCASRLAGVPFEQLFELVDEPAAAGRAS